MHAQLSLTVCGGSVEREGHAGVCACAVMLPSVNISALNSVTSVTSVTSETSVGRSVRAALLC